MLQSIRDHTQGWIAGIIISMLILSFALWGIHSYIGEGPAEKTVVAKVNGIEITKGQLAATYERLRRQIQMQSNSTEQLPAQTESTLKARALQALISLQVLKNASLEQGYRISQPQVDIFLEGMPEFQVNGKFSLERFQQLLQTTMLNPGEFLELIKTSLLIDQPRLGYIFTSFALPNEVANNIALVNQERDILYAVLPDQASIKQAIQISQDQIRAYYDAHQDEFKTPEQVSIEYIELSMPDIIATIHPTDDELKKFYNETMGTSTPATNNQTTSQKPTIQPFEQAKDRVKQAYVRQQAEEKFASMREQLANVTYEHPETLETAAKTLHLPVKTSEPFTKEKGEKGITTVSKIRDTAFSNDVLNSRNNSDVIQITSDDAVVIRVKNHVPASLLELKTVENQIKEKLKTKELDIQTAKLAQEIQQKMSNSNHPEQIAQQYHLTWKRVGFTTRQNNKIDSAILETAFAMPKPQNNQKSTFASAKIPNGYALIQLNAVRNGSVTAQKTDQNKVFAEQIQNTQGLIEYELYKQSMIQQAKVVVEN